MPRVWSFGVRQREEARRPVQLHRRSASRCRATSPSRYDDDEIHQILLHEVAHAIAGPRAGHGPKWASDRRRARLRRPTHARRRGRARARPVGRAVPGRARALPLPRAESAAELRAVPPRIRPREPHRLAPSRDHAGRASQGRERRGRVARSPARLVACPSQPCRSPSGNGSSPPRAPAGGSTRARSRSTSPTPARSAADSAPASGCTAPDDLTHLAARAVPGRRRRRALARPLRRDLAARRDRPHGDVAPAHGEPARPADIDVVNLYAATPDVPPSLAGGTRQVGRSVQTVAQALSTIARDAVDLFDPANAGRIRECSGDDCDDRLPRHVARGHAAAGARCSGAATARRCVRTAPARRAARPGAARASPAGQARKTPSRQLGHARATRRARVERTARPPRTPCSHELDRAARRADQVTYRAAQPLEGGARDRGLGRRVVDAEADERVDDGAGRELVLDREPDRSSAAPSRAARSPLARGDDRDDRALAALLLQGEDPLGDRRAVAQRPASTTTPRPASTARRRRRSAMRARRASSSSRPRAPVKLVGDEPGPGSPRRPATTPPSRSASAAAPRDRPPATARSRRRARRGHDHRS